ncbi:putative RNA-directed DNA polymerase from transposon BS [Stylophora pistillata]|uniref:Putative RNA-directed DNA polymerase from transposon BS n=1 Tax=Stylophora pistillata TaxID=50429 RepID=A0A2B4REU2_STYPI|nr:putative RNA-directed DNA polymerase from transposon BS [Stylophora pistillata]
MLIKGTSSDDASATSIPVTRDGIISLIKNKVTETLKRALSDILRIAFMTDPDGFQAKEVGAQPQPKKAKADDSETPVSVVSGRSDKYYAPAQYPDIKGTNDFVVSPVMQSGMKEDIERVYGLSQTKDLFIFDEGLAAKQASFISVRPLVSALQALEPTGEVNVDEDVLSGPDPDHIKALIEDAIVLLGNAHCRLNSWRQQHFAYTFPFNWKEAEVIPILRDGDHEKAVNNRPIAMLAVVSKVFERIVLNQFRAYLTKNNRLTTHQSGNKTAHSTETLNILLTDNIFEAMDKKLITALVLLDLSKAFDSIDHARLLHKLFTIGASHSTVKWFKSYLTGRMQYERVGSANSDALPITHGVPQGAILSPLLFCIYLNDLPTAPTFCNLESYVDDSEMFMSFPLVELDAAIEKLEQDLYSVAQWCFRPCNIVEQMDIIHSYTDCDAASNSEEDTRGSGNLSTNSSKLARPVLVSVTTGDVDGHPCHSSNVGEECISPVRPGSETPIVENNEASGMASFRECCRAGGLPPQVCDILMASWREGTKKRYEGPRKLWTSGIDAQYTGPSTRAAATSMAADSGVPLEDIIAAADFITSLS